MSLRIIALIVPIGALCVLAIPIVMRYSVAPYIYTDATSTPSAQAAMILGASVVHGKPSPILAARADGAIALYKMGKVQKILVSGDNGEQRYDEVTPVRKYLTDAGIPDNDIFLDHAGFDTYSSMYRARDVFQAHSLIIVTQDFHMPRALFLARRLGIDASGYVAQGQSPQVFEYLREIPASIKALFDLYTARTPRYLGDPIPLTGVGTTTWY